MGLLSHQEFLILNFRFVLKFYPRSQGEECYELRFYLDTSATRGEGSATPGVEPTRPDRLTSVWEGRNLWFRGGVGDDWSWKIVEKLILLWWALIPCPLGAGTHPNLPSLGKERCAPDAYSFPFEHNRQASLFILRITVLTMFCFMSQDFYLTVI